MVIGQRSVIRGCVQLMFIVCVMANEERLLKDLTLSNSSLYAIALDVCYYLGTDSSECEENFMSPPRDVGRPSKLQIVDQSEYEVVYEITPSDVFQVIVWMSDNGDVMQNTIGPGGVHDKTYVNSTMNYTFWTAALSENGTHSPWLQGPKRFAWHHALVVEQQKDYIIQMYEKYGNTSEVEVNFKWNSSSESRNQIFNVKNDCENRALVSKRIHSKLGENGTYTTRVHLKDLCRFSVAGTLGRGSLEYAIEPQPVKMISVLASPGHSGWDVRVRWARPPRDPQRYLVVLRAATQHALNVSGNVTEVTFCGVTGRGLYNVSVINFVQSVSAHAFVRAIFPAEEVTSSLVPVLSSLLALMLLATMVVGAITWCKRRRHSKLRHLFHDEDPIDLSKKFFLDVTYDLPAIEDGWEVRPEKLQLHEVIGEGAFGVVRRGTLEPGKEVAVKMLKDYPSREEVRSFRAESELMKSVGAHAHVVSLMGCCSGRRPLIVAEYCSRGDLLSYLRCSWDVMVSKRNAKYNNNNCQSTDYRNGVIKGNTQLVVNKLYDLVGMGDMELTYVDLLSFCRQIAMGMEFLASNRVVHRDLAARNVLVTSDRTLKIADFGLSRDVYEENQYKQKGNGKMPIKWMALESLTHRIYTTQSDVWSFGVVAWEVATVGASPYPGLPPARLPRLLRSGYRMPRPGTCTLQLHEMMLACWRVRPRERPTFTDLHSELDSMLQSACAEQYLALDLNADDDAKPEEPRSRYSRLMDFARSKRRRGECSEPLRTHCNHYSSPPTPPMPPSAHSILTAPRPPYTFPAVSAPTAPASQPLCT